MILSPGQIGRWFVVLWVASAVAGCSDGTVVVQGRVSIDGEPVDNGRLILNPVGGGQKGIGGVDADSTFRLFAPGSKNGVLPGKYHVLFKHDLELTERARKKLERGAAGLDLAELSVSYSSPRDVPIEITDAGADDLIIQISRKDGWRQIVGD